MKLNLSTGYALRALVHLARQPAGKRVPSHALAEAEGIPERFVVKVLMPLVRARILHSMKGPQGGYSLGRPPEGITLLEVVETVGNTVRGEAPDVLEGRGDAEGGKVQQRLQAVCDGATRLERKVLAGVSVADLVERPKSRKR